MNFCKDCKWAEGDPAQPYSLKCGSPRNGVDHTAHERYAVSGEAQPTVRAALASSCLAMRTHVRHPVLGMTLCGPSGVWWMAKE